MRFEKWLDKHTTLRQGEFPLSDEARNRLFAKSNGQVAVPNGAIERVQITGTKRFPETIYEITPPRSAGTSKQHEAVGYNEKHVMNQARVVDSKLFGEVGHRFDEVFAEASSQSAQDRYRFIHRRARKIKAGTALGAILLAGAIDIFAGGPVLHVAAVSQNDCSERMINGNYIQKFDPATERDVNIDRLCTFEGVEYVINQHQDPANTQR